MAFATTAGFSTESNIDFTCAGKPISTTYHYKIEYPFNRDYVIPNGCDVNRRLVKLGSLSEKTSAEFYVSPILSKFKSNHLIFHVPLKQVTVGVLSMLYSMAALAVYAFASNLYESNPMVPFIDLVGTAILTFFWFIGWCAWVANSGNVKSFGRDLVEKARAGLPSETLVADTESSKFAGLTISLVSVFRCMCTN